jgi:hypothetical protein
MNKVLALQAALRCFTCGLLALVPIIGLPFAIAAMVLKTRASGHAPDDWHVAHRYAMLGMLFATLGLLLNVTALGWVAIVWMEHL